MSDFETIWHFPLVRTSAGIEVTVSQIVLTALVVILGLVLAWYLKRLLGRQLTKSKVDPNAALVIQRMFFYGVLILLFITALGMLDIPLTALAFISGNQATIDFLLPHSRRFEGLIVVTLGADGSVALVDGSPLFWPAQAVPNPVDATGCGDAFQAAFTVAYFSTGNVEQALRRGTARAATVIQHYGATQ